MKWTKEYKKEYQKEYMKEYSNKNNLMLMGAYARKRKMQSELLRKKQREYRKSEAGREIRKQQYIRDRYKTRARQTLIRAVKKGIVRKTLCLLCGSDNVQAHHEDYDKPLEVIWLCDIDHKKFEKVKRILELIKKEGKDG